MDARIQYQYRVDKKEPFAALLRRLHEELSKVSAPVAFEFSFADPAPGGVSAVDRAVKKFPQLAGLIETVQIPGMEASQKSITGGDADLPFAMLAEVADGMPRSLPFDSAGVRLISPAFDDRGTGLPVGIVANDNWWVTGRKRSLVVDFVVEAGESAKALPAPAGALGAFLATLGKPAKSSVTPLIKVAATGTLAEVTRKYRAKLGDLVAQAGMPHSVPLTAEAGSRHALKPALDRHFQPLGYSCVGGTGTFTLRRRTAANHVVEIYMDVGTWSRKVLAQFRVHAPGDHFSLRMPVAPGLESALQVPIGDAGRWERIVENLAVFAAYLDRQVVPEIDAAAGVAPEWFDAPAP